MASLLPALLAQAGSAAAAAQALGADALEAALLRATAADVPPTPASCLALLSLATAFPQLRERCVALAACALVQLPSDDAAAAPAVELAALSLAALAPSATVTPRNLRPGVAACVEGFRHRFTPAEWAALADAHPAVDAYRNAGCYGLALGLPPHSSALAPADVVARTIAARLAGEGNAAAATGRAPQAAGGAVDAADAVLVDVAGVHLRRRVVPSPALPTDEPPFRLVETATTRGNLARLAAALSIGRGRPDRMPPVLLEGPPGAGKTATLRHLAWCLGHGGDVIELHLDDVSDGRALLGSYVCTDVPGEFRWQPGAITQAVTAGRWVVIEDVDRAPFEVLAALAPLLADRRLVLPGRVEPLVAHPDFVLFATRSTPPPAAAAAAGAGTSADAAADAVDADYHSVLLAAGSTGTVTGPLGAFLHHWLRVPIQPLSTAIALPIMGGGVGAGASSNSSSAPPSELAQVLTARHPHLPPSVVQGMLLSFQLLQLAHGGGGASPSSSSSPAAAQLLQLLPPGLRSLSQHGRSLSPRDLLRWAARIEGLTDVADRAEAATVALGGGASAVAVADVFLPDRTKEAILAEALAVFAGHLPQPGLRVGLGRALAAVWGLSDDTADALVRRHKPDVSVVPAPPGGGSGDVAYLRVGRAAVPASRNHVPGGSSASSVLPRGFAPTRHGLALLERIAACVALREPALLVGETGNGKTSAVQVLADAVGARLTVINLNMQTDSSDLLGGYKPVHMKQLAAPLAAGLAGLFKATFSQSANEGFLGAVETAAARGDWPKLSKGVAKAVSMALAKLRQPVPPQAQAAQQQLAADWSALSKQLAAFDRQRAAIEEAQAAASAGGSGASAASPSSRAAAFAFQFVEGALVRAVRCGHWVLLDELNLASPETLQRLAGLLEGGGITLTEKGDADRVPPHPGFRLFGAMNPATDVGKRDLPPALRSRFTEVYVDDVEDRDDLAAVVAAALAHIDGGGNDAALVQRVVTFYLVARGLSAPRTGVLRDGGGGRPHYSLRSLTRALRITGDLMAAGYPLDYALHESVATSFLVQLDEPSARVLGAEIHKAFPLAAANSSSSAPAPAAADAAAAAPGSKKRKKGAAGGGSDAASAASTSAAADGGQAVALRGSAAGRDPTTHVKVGSVWLRRGPLPPTDPAQPDEANGAVRYVLVPSVRRHIHSLARAVVSGRFPVLLQGPTSSGKTSMVEYLGALTGHECVRINNHEHTDLAEYLGTYVSEPSTGRLVYTDGLLVTALRRGQWIILDELNLSPSEVLEALNRLLDDNRELFIPETQEVVRPHPSFMLFATQNPAGLYGGRKQLSLAFRNRFIEMHIDDMPDAELEAILTARGRLPPSFVSGMVATMTELRRVRQSSNVFAGRHGFVTTRDLLRWAARRPDSYQSLAEEGYALLAERLRLPEEKATVRDVLAACCGKGAELDPDALYARACPSFGGEDVGGAAGGAGGGSPSVAAPASAEPDSAEPPARKRARLRTNVLIPTLPAEGAAADGDDGDEPPPSLFARPFHALSADEFAAVTTARMRRLTRQLVKGRRTAQQQRADDSDEEDADGAGADAADLTPGVVPGTEGLTTVSFTRSLQRMFTLIGRCIAHDEPVLLVGDTGCGKTTVIQIFALLLGVPLHVVNCHAHTETADFLGSLRPVRAKAAHRARFVDAAARAAALLPADARATLLQGGAPAAAAAASDDVDMGGAAGSSSVSSVGSEYATALASLPPEDVLARLEALLQPSASLEADAAPPVAASLPPAHADALVAALADARAAFASWSALFEWVDGPLVSSLRAGHFFLLDEASLAEDAVLERLNSVLEPSRTLTLAEKGELTAEDGPSPAASSSSSSSAPQLVPSSLLIQAAPGFRFFATMNPGGDFGKRELSPALRNRFTEVWVPSITDPADLTRIVADKAAAIAQAPSRRLPGGGVDTALAAAVSRVPALGAFVRPLVAFVRWFDDHASSGRLVQTQPAAADAAPAAPGRDARQRVLTVTLRDLHAWLEFMAAASSGATQQPSLLEDDAEDGAAPSSSSSLWEAYAHGACLTLLDGLGLGTGLPPSACASIRAAAADFIVGQAPPGARPAVAAVLSPRAGGPPVGVQPAGPSDGSAPAFGAPPFFIPLGPQPVRSTAGAYSLEAPTTRVNLGRLLRALQLPKPILLEGSPGVGKSSLIEALARASGHALVRINLSEQTDLADLFGQDLPASSSTSTTPPSGTDGGSDGSRFVWSDGVFLKALKAGHWVLLDELNLASQAVLEGLNAVLDHRATVFIPELGRSFACPRSFRVFATQNPVGQGGGRKGLPKSFLNRFTKAYVEPLGAEDQAVIARALFPQLDVPLADVYPEMAAAGASESTSGTAQPTLLQAMIAFNDAMHHDTMGGGPPAAATVPDGDAAPAPPTAPLYGTDGRPWEFNLRDLFRWCELVVASACALDAPTRGALEPLLATRLPRRLDPSHGLDTVYLARLRSPLDRAAALTRFTATLAAAGVPLAALAHPELHDAPLLRVGDGAFALDDLVLPRAGAPGQWSPQPSPADAAAPSALAPLADAVRLLLSRPDSPPLSPPPSAAAAAASASSLAAAHSTLRHAYQLARCVRHAWPTLLVGPASTGKTAAVRALAELAGAPLREINVTPSTDATELLGCFEQVDPVRTRARVSEPVLGLLRAAAATATRLLAGAATAADGDSGAAAAAAGGIASALSSLEAASAAVIAAVGVDSADHKPAMAALSAALDTVAAVAASCVAAIPAAAAAGSPPLAADVTAAVSSLRSWALSQLSGPGAVPVGHFEWVDGVLVRALERGEWLLVDNVNFCSPAVVDRLNALLEPHGTLLISECGLDAAGQPRVVRAHPSFRVFFAMNASLGDVSRALRNRCVELWFDGVAAAAVSPPAGGAFNAEFARVADAICGVPPPGGDVDDDGALVPGLRAAAEGIYRRLCVDGSSGADLRAIVAACGVRSPAVADALLALHRRSAAAVATREGRLFGAAPPSLSHLRRLAEAVAAGMCGGPSASPADLARACALVYAHAGGSLLRVAPALPAVDGAAVVALQPTGMPPLAAVDAHTPSFATSPAIAGVLADLCGLPELAARLAQVASATGAAEAPLQLAQQAQLLARLAPFGGSSAADATVRRALLEAALPECHQRPELPEDLRLQAVGTLPAPLQLASRDLSLSHELAAACARGLPPAVFASLALTAVRHQLAADLAAQQRVEAHLLSSGAAVVLAAVTATGGSKAVTPSALVLAAIVTQAVTVPGLGGRAAAEALGSLHPALAPLYAALTHVRSGLAAVLAPAGDTATLPSPALLATCRACTRIIRRIVEQLHAAPVLLVLAAGAGAAASADADADAPAALARLHAAERALDRVVVLYRQLLKALRPGWDELCALAPAPAASAAQQLALTETLISGGSADAVEPATAPSSSAGAASPALLVPVRVKDTLWKRGGHPLMPSSTALAAGRAAIQGAVAAVQERAAACAPPFVSLRHRRVLLDAVATYAWAVTAALSDPAKAAASDATVAGLAGTLQQELADVLAPPPAAGVDGAGDADGAPDAAPMAVDDSDDVPGFGTGETADAEERRLLTDIGVTPDVLAARRKRALAAAATLVECWCLSEERTLMAPLWGAYAAAVAAGLPALDDDVDLDAATSDALAPRAAAVRAVLPRLRAWLAVALAGTSWAADELQPHQSLLWACEAALHADADSDGVLLAALARVMGAHHTSLQVSWHVRLAAVPPVPGDSAASRDDAPAGCVSFGRLLHVHQVAASLAIAGGEVDLLSSSGTTGEQLAPVASSSAPSSAHHHHRRGGSASASLLGFEAGVYSVLMSAGHMAARAAAPAATDTAPDATAVQALARDEAALMRASLATTLAAFAPLCDAPAAARSELQRWIGDAFTPLSWCGGACRDVRFSRAVASGAVAAAAAAVDAAAATASSIASPAAAVAHAWHLVSRLRLQLLTPASPVDPSSAPRVKAELCATEQADASAALAALVSATAALRGCPNATAEAALPPVAALQHQLAGLGDQIHAYSGRVIVRAAADGAPSSRTFLGWYRELHGFLRALVSDGSLDFTLAALLHPQPPATPAEAEPLADAFRRVTMWEASSLEFARRALREYGGAFPDATHPPLEPLLGLRYALGFARAHAGALLARASAAPAAADGATQQLALVPLPRSLAAAAPSAYHQHLLTALCAGVQPSRAQAAAYRLLLSSSVLASCLAPTPAAARAPLSELLVAAARFALAQETGRVAEAAAAASSSGTHHHSDADEEAKAEAAFRADFPDYFASHFAGLLPKPDTLGPDAPAAKPAAAAAAPRRASPIADVADPLVLAFSFLAAVTGDAKVAAGGELSASGADSTDGLWAALARCHDEVLEAGLPESLARLRADHDVAHAPAGALAALGTAATALSLTRLGGLLAPPLKVESGGAAFKGAGGPLPPLGRRVYNFFRDANVGEASVAIRPLRALAGRVAGLLRQFPRNEVLLLVLRLVHGVLRMPPSTPVAGLLAGVTLLYGKAHEWEANAASFVSLQPELGALSALITRWRRLELSCWRYQLHVAAQDDERAAAELWLRLYGLIEDGAAALLQKQSDDGGSGIEAVAGWALPEGLVPAATAPAPDAAAAADEASPTTVPGLCKVVFESADRFLRSASLGQARIRLALTKATAAHLHARAVAAEADGGDAPRAALLRRLAAVVAGVHSHYDQYAAALARALDAASAPVLKDVSDQVLLHRWDEQSYYALQETSEKGHRLVHKAVQRFREVLATPVAPIVDAGYTVNPAALSPPLPRSARAGADGDDEETSAGGAVAQLTALLPASADAGSAATPDAALSLPSSSFAARLPALSGRMVSLLAKRSAGGLLAPAAQAYRAAATSDALAAGAALTGAWDTIRDPEAWKTSKRSVLVDLLRGLGRQGLSHLSSAVPCAAGETHLLLQLPHPLLLAAGAETKQRLALLAHADADFHRSLDRLIRMRGLIAAGRVHEDIAPHEHRKMAGYAGHVLFTLAQQRSALAVLAPQARALDAVIDALSAPPPSSPQPAAALVAAARAVADAASASRWALQTARTALVRGRQLIKGAAQTLTGSQPAGADVASEAVVVGAASEPPLDGLAADASAAFNAALGARLRQLNGLTDRLAALAGQLTAAAEPLERLLADSDADTHALRDTLPPPATAAAPVAAFVRDPAGLASAASAAASAVAAAHAALAQLAADPDSVAAAVQGAEPTTLLAGYERGVLEAALQAWPAATAAVHADADDGGDAVMSLQPMPTGASTPLLDALVQELLLAVQSVVKATAAADDEVAAPAQEPAVPGTDGDDVDMAAAPPAAADADADADDDDDAGVPLYRAHERYVRTLRAFRLHRVVAAAQALHAANASAAPHAVAMLRVLAAALAALTADFTGFHASCASFGVHATATFLNLLRQGLCVPPKKDDEGKGDGKAGDGAGAGGQQRQSQQMADGTGMGEGAGAKDVSDQITCEEQVLGLKNDQPQPQQQQQPGQEERPGGGGDGKDDGIDMQADFDGAIQDAPKPPPGEEDDNDDAPPPEEEDMAREMGSVGGDDDDDAQVVDEKMWDGDDDAEEPPAKQGKSSKAAPQQPQGADALRAKEGDEAPPPDGAAADEQQPEDGGADADKGAPPPPADKKPQVASSDAKPPKDSDDDDAGKEGDDDGAKGGDDAKPQRDDDADGGDDADDNQPEGGDDDDDKGSVANLDDVAPRAPERALGDDGDDDALQPPEDAAADAAAAADDGGEEEKEVGADDMGDDNEELRLNMDEQMRLDGEEEGEQGDADDGGSTDSGEAAGEEEEQAPPSEGDGAGAGAAADEEPPVQPDDADGAPQQQPPAPPAGGGGDDADQQQPQPSQLPEGTPDATGTDAIKSKPGDTAPPPPPGGRKQRKPQPQQGAAAAAEQQQEEAGGPDDEQQPQPGGDDAAGGAGGDDDELDGAASDVEGGGAEAELPDGGNDDNAAKANQQQQGPADEAAERPAANDKVRPAADANPYADPERAMRRWQARLVEKEGEDGGAKPKPAPSSRSDEQQQQQQGDKRQQQPSAAGDRPQGEDGANSEQPPPSDVRLDDAGGRGMLLPVEEAAPRGKKELADDDEEGGGEEDGFPPSDDDGGEAAAPPPGAAPDAAASSMAVDDDDEEAEGGDGDDEDAAAPRRRDARAGGGDDGSEDDATDGAPEDQLPLPADAVLRSILSPAAAGPAPPPTVTEVTVRTTVHTSAAADAAGVDDTGAAVERDDADAAAAALAPADTASLRAGFGAMLLSLASTRGGGALDVATQAWGALAALTAEPAARLSERLRLILEPTLASKLGGEYRSGKRINMRRVIPYIASQFRKDKIWMRRSTPSKRTYQVLVAVDDSRSMAPGNTGGGALACEAVALLTKALSRLEVGDIGLVSFGDSLRLLHPLEAPFTDEAGARALSQFTFAQESTAVGDALEGIVGLLDAARGAGGARAAAAASSSHATSVQQLVFVVSDGMLGSGAERGRVRRAITDATARGALVVLLIVDRAGGGGGGGVGAGAGAGSSAAAPGDASILRMQSVSFAGGRVVKSSYLDDYPFPYYLVMHDVHALPEVLSDALRQWFEMVARSGPGGSV